MVLATTHWRVYMINRVTGLPGGILSSFPRHPFRRAIPVVSRSCGVIRLAEVRRLAKAALYSKDAFNINCLWWPRWLSRVQSNGPDFLKIYMFILFLPLDNVATRLDNCTFHESVDLTHFEATRTLVVRPPEGEVHVNSCEFDFKANFVSGRRLNYSAGMIFLPF